jgi:Flp pilus assembly protein CpaB
VAAAIAAVITGISAARPPDPPSVDVVRTTRDVAAGATLTVGDVRLQRLPRGSVPDAGLTDLDAVLGQQVSAPVAAGQVLTRLDLGAPRASRPDMVVAPLRLTDSDVAGLLRVGDRVDVVAASDSAPKARVVASRVLVVGLPQPTEGGGLAGGEGAGSLVLVELDLQAATVLSDASAAGRVSVVLR